MSLAGFVIKGFSGLFVNSPGAVFDQKTSKFFVSHQEESMAGHVNVNGVY
jgi:hypothetical protein